MKFDDMDEGYQFWLTYGVRVGFGVRKHFTNKKGDNSILSCRLVSCKE